MSDKDFEQLSALLDDEAEWQSAFAKRVARDGALREKWSRYSTARHAMHNECNLLGVDFQQKMAAAMAQEAPILAPKALPNGRRQVAKRWMAGAAVAATVAGVTLVSLQQLTNVASPEIGQSVAANESTSTDSVVTAPVALVSSPSNVSTHWVLPASKASRDVLLEQRLNGLYSKHVEQSGHGVVQGVLPYSRLVGYDQVQPAQ